MCSGLNLQERDPLPAMARVWVACKPHREFLGPALILVRTASIAPNLVLAIGFKCVPGKEDPSFCFTPSPVGYIGQF